MKVRNRWWRSALGFFNSDESGILQADMLRGLPPRV